MSAFTMAVYKRPFAVGSHRALVTMRARMDGLHSEFAIDGAPVASDFTPATGEEAIRNHRLRGTLPDGRVLEVEAGYVNWITVGIAATLNGAPIHESHPRRRIAYPAKAAAMVRKGGTMDKHYDTAVWSRNKVPIAVDLALGLLFYAVAKLTDLRTAALVGAGVGIALVGAQRFIKTDIIGGMALFGIVLALISAGLAILFQDDDAVKMRTTIMGLIGAAFFLGDGLLLGGKRLGAGMARYLPYTDIVPRRLAIGMGVMGLVMAGLNTVVIAVASTDVWLFYTTFVDFVVAMGLIMLVFRYARSGSGTVVPA